MAFGWRIPQIVKRIFSEKEGNFYETWSQDTNYTKEDKLKVILSNPAALFIFLLLPDLCSLGKFVLKDRKTDKIIESHPILDLLANPNPMQTEKQFKWDYMFWRLLGTANMLSDSKVLKKRNILYWLDPSFIEWPKWFLENRNTIFLSETAITKLKRKILKYKTANQELPFEYGQLKQFFDITNGVSFEESGWFEGPSKVDAIYKIVKNSDNLLDSKNVNSLLARKFMVAGKHDVSNTSTLPMSENEKNNIEKKIFSKKSIHAVKSMIDIKRFVEDLGAMEKIDKAFMNDAFLIGKVVNLPKDVIESFEQGSTYENQEKARALVISYCIQSAGDDFGQGILDHFKVEGLSLTLAFDHLPFVQTFEKDRAETVDKKASAFKKMVEAGADQEQAAAEAGLELDTFTEPKNLGGSKTNGDGEATE